MGTKGSWRRPPAIPEAELAEKWERTFGRTGEPRCKYGYRLNGCELGYPGCACADEAILEELRSGKPCCGEDPNIECDCGAASSGGSEESVPSPGAENPCRVSFLP